MTIRLASMIALVSLGCTLPDEATSEVTQAAGGNQCPIWECGANSPVIANHGFYRLNEAGVENPEGFRIVSFTRGAAVFDLDVSGGRLLGRQGGAVVLQGASLVGAEISIEHVPSGFIYQVRINGVTSDIEYWANNGALPAPLLESYLLEWSEAGIPRWTNLCSRPIIGSSPPGTMPGEHTLLFDGDQIDAASKTVGSTLDHQWFNIGCAGHALAKMALTGHTEAARISGGFSTTISGRTTMLKMIVGDYCGTGHPYTVAGQPLTWKDSAGWMSYADPPIGIEARWTKTGAVCLETARITAHPTLESEDEFGLDPTDEMDSVGCSVPLCSDTVGGGNTDPEALLGHHLVSANPW